VKIAIPVAEKKVCMHFGHCEFFAFFEVDQKAGKILSRKDVCPPPHEPGILPSWVKEQGATLVLAGGMGQKAQGLFGQNGIEVITGIQETDPEKAVTDFLQNKLMRGNNTCDH
jgi:predicted Fe-Mo cluster-binding NifX family protein